MKTKGFLADRKTAQLTASAAAMLLLTAMLALAGCGSVGGPGAGVPGPGLAGQVFGGGPQNPIGGSTVTLWAMGTSGYGSAPTSLTATTSDAAGGFTFSSYVCPGGNPGVQTYVTATGGNAGSGSNSAIGLMAVTGPCNNPPGTTVLLNELTTVAAHWALAQFSDSTGHDFGSSSTNPTGLTNAVNLAMNNLVTSVGTNLGNTGIPASFLTSLSCPTPPSGGQAVNCDALDRLDTLANIIASCVNSSGPSSTQCSTLFTNTGSSTDTLQATHVIVTNPTANVSAIFGITPPPGMQLYAPNLSSAPADFTLALNYTNGNGSTFQNPETVAIDASGNAWVTDVLGQSLTELSPWGSVTATFSGSSNFDHPFGVAIDGSSNVWVSNCSTNCTPSAITGVGGSVSQVSGGTVTIAKLNPSAASLNQPEAVVIDKSNNVWISNTHGNSLGELDAGCTSSSCTASNLPISTESAPIGLGIDASGNQWVTGTGTGNVVEFISGVIQSPITGLLSPYGLALDASSDVWIASEGGNRVWEVVHGTSSATAYHPTGAAMSSTYGVAIDSAGNVWATNQTGGVSGSVSELTQASSYATGFSFATTGANYNWPQFLALDASGNVWVANCGSVTTPPVFSCSGTGAGGVSQVIGLASPVLTPMVACLQGASAVPVCKP